MLSCILQTAQDRTYEVPEVLAQGLGSSALTDYVIIVMLITTSVSHFKTRTILSEYFQILLNNINTGKILRYIPSLHFDISVIYCLSACCVISILRRLDEARY